jgi:hypothetical protein
MHMEADDVNAPTAWRLFCHLDAALEHKARLWSHRQTISMTEAFHFQWQRVLLGI